MQPAVPVVVVDRGGLDLSILDTVADAELHVEAIDVKNQEYDVFDSGGRLMQFQVEKGVVKLKLVEEKSEHAKQLRHALIAYLKAINSTRLLDDWDLNSLISLCRNRR